MANYGGKGFILTTKFYKSPNYVALLVPKKWKLEGKSELDTEGAAVKKKEQTTTKQQATQKIHINELHTKLDHSIKDKIHTTKNHIHYTVKGTLELCNDFTTENTR